jgi:Fe2+ or Zn2+ uptake regulation protein
VLSVKIAELEQRLREQGLKLTRPRQAVLEVLSRSGSRLSPAEIHRQGRRSYRRLGLVTVYRTLALLEEMGLVQRVHTETGCHSFAGVRSPEGHHHQLICKDCGRVEEFSDCASEQLLAKLQKETGFAVEDHRLEVIGCCPKCQ